jgi:hypothetical protein
VVIVDKKSDLNIYKERGSEEGGGCGESAASSCCGAKIPISGPDDAANIDFNEWVGEWLHAPRRPCAVELTWL